MVQINTKRIKSEMLFHSALYYNCNRY